MWHQRQALDAAWRWGLREFARRPEHAQLANVDVVARWTALAGDPPERP